MACIHPHIIKNPKWTPDNPTGIARYIVVPCGKCSECKKRYINQWTFRVEQHIKKTRNNMCLTLTYAPENLPVNENGTPTLCKDDYQKFLKRIRQVQKRKYKDDGKITYIVCGEYGDFENERTARKGYNPHFHMLLFNCILSETDLQEAWNLGWICKDGNGKHPFSTRAVRYVLKYVFKQRTGELDKYIKDGMEPTFVAQSQGLGSSWLTEEQIEYYRKHPNTFWVTTAGGIKVSLPKYYKDKLKQYGIVLKYNGPEFELPAPKMWENAKKKYPTDFRAAVQWYQNSLNNYELQKFKRLNQWTI